MAGVEGQVKEEQLDPEREARRKLALRHVRQYPNKVLKMPANEVERFDAALASLVERMAYLMREANGVGLAAPQLGILQRLLVYRIDDEAPLVALANPHVVESSEELSTEEEGCLSLGEASVVVEVERPIAVTVEAASPEGKPVQVEAEGLEARVLQHELDHLEGILTIDRASPEQRRTAIAQLRPQPVLGAVP